MRTQTTEKIDRIAGEAIKAERKRIGLSQKQMAESISVTFQQMQKYETGKNRISLSALVFMERFAGINIDNILAEARAEAATIRKAKK
jgi:transcriptional regulator with XRE-family HTH domain